MKLQNQDCKQKQHLAITHLLLFRSNKQEVQYKQQSQILAIFFSVTGGGGLSAAGLLEVYAAAFSHLHFVNSFYFLLVSALIRNLNALSPVGVPEKAESQKILAPYMPILPLSFHMLCNFSCRENHYYTFLRNMLRYDFQMEQQPIFITFPCYSRNFTN